MKIYGKTDEIVVREMVGSDCEKLLELMTEHGKNEDFTVRDIEVLWEFRKQKGDIQCTVTSADGDIIYGFGGIIHSKLGVDLFKAYDEYTEQASEIITSCHG